MLDDLCVIVLCPDCNSGGLKYTTNSIKAEVPNVACLAMVASNTCKNEILELSKYCRVCKGGDMITSLIDAGIKEARRSWCLVVMEGSRIKSTILRKYFYFLKSDKDVLFPVVDRKYLFDEASINGILISKKAYEDIGDLGEGSNIRELKLLWAGRAIDKGYKFKAIVGGSFA